MRWFRRNGKSPFPDDMLDRLDLFGRFELDPQTSGIEGGEVWSTCVAPFVPYANADRDGFLTALHALVAGDTSGFVTFGAARLTWELLSGDALSTPAAWPLIDAGIAFKQDRGLPAGWFLTGYEQQRIQQRQRDRTP